MSSLSRSLFLLAGLALLPCLRAEDARLEKLLQAVSFDDTDQVHALLRAGVDPDATPKNSRLSGFLTAVADHKLGIVKLFLNAGADPNSAVENQESALMLACRADWRGGGDMMELITTLLERGADIHADKDGALRNASAVDLEVVKLLLKKGARPDIECLASSVTAVRTDIFEHLLSLGVDPKSRLKDGGTLFHAAARSYELELHRVSEDVAHRLWQRLLDLGVPLETRDREGASPLHVAAEEMRDGIMSWLLRQKMDLEARDLEGRTPVMLAARGQISWAPQHCLDLLIAAGARLDGKDKAGLTVVDHAEQSGDWENIIQVLRAGAKPPDAAALLRRFIGDTGRQHIADKVVLELTRLLLPSLSDVSTFRAEGRSLLTWCVMMNQPALAKELLAAGAKIHEPDDAGLNALQWAVKTRNPAMISFLIEAGATGDHAAAAKVKELPFRPASAASDGQPYPKSPAAADVWSDVAEGNLAALKKFTKSGPASFAIERGGLHPVHLAAARGHTEVLAHILEVAPEERAAKTVDGLSLLQIAIAAGQTKSVLWLVDHPGSVGKKEVLSEAAHIVFQGSNTELLMSLMDAGWSPMSKEERAAVLRMAAYRQDMVLLKRLRPLKLGPELHLSEQAGRGDPFGDEHHYLISEIVKHGSLELMKFLLSIVQESPDLDWQVHLAQSIAACARHQNEDMLKVLLIDGKADIDCTAQGQETALHRMAYEGSRVGAELLIKHGARADLIDAKGQTPEAVARLAKHDELATWLKEQSANQGSGKR
jgi:ankyrin repeat protein